MNTTMLCRRRFARTVGSCVVVLVLFLPRAVLGDGPECCGTGDDCTIPHPTPCCLDEACCKAVCALDAYCCTNEWDGFCVGMADAVCGCMDQDPPGNDVCEGATPIGLGDTTISNLCATAGPPAHATCTDDQVEYLGQDVWYKYTASFSGALTISTCNQLDPNWDSQIAVYVGCGCDALEDPPYGCNNDAEGCAFGSSTVAVNVAHGVCYLIRVGSSYFGPSGTGTLTLSTTTPPCQLDPPGSAISEGEPCGVSNNGGCQNLPATPTFTPMACNSIITGMGWSDEKALDFDWYQLTILQQTPVTVTLQSEFGAQFGFAQTVPVGSPSCANWTGVISPSRTTVGGCVVSSLTTTLAPGNWWLRVAPSGLDDLPCGGPVLGNDYVMTVSCQLPCPGDLNGDGVVNAFDLALCLANWGEEPGNCNTWGLAAMLGAWGPCPDQCGPCCLNGQCVCIPGTWCLLSGGIVGCSNCNPAACQSSTENCCGFHNSPGCADGECCGLVCAAQPFCCNNIWDSFCVQLAQQLCEECFNPPPNDDCVDSIEILEGDIAFSTVGATTDGVPHSQCQFDDQTYNDIWFDHTARCGGVLTVSTCDQAAYDTDLVVYSGCDCDTMAFAGCNDDDAACTLVPFTSLVTVPAVIDQCYKLRVGGFAAGNAGEGTLTVDCLCQNNDECPAGQTCLSGQCVGP